MLAQQKVVLEKNEEMVGRRLEAVIDSSTDEDRLWIGRTRLQAPDADSITYIEGEGLSPGAFLDVEITGYSGYDLIARPVAER